MNPKAATAAAPLRAGAPAPASESMEHSLPFAATRSTGDDPVARTRPRVRLDQAQWQRIAESLPATLTTRVQRRGERYRGFVEDVLQIAVSDLRWHELPSRGRSWRTAYVRFLRWCDNRIWDQVIDALHNEPELRGALARRVGEHRRASERRRKQAALDNAGAPQRLSRAGPLR